MSSPEVERFEMTEDDLAGAYDPTNRRRPRMSKNQAIYGIWADKDSDDEAPPSFSKKRKDYSMPISFVSGGIKQGDKIKKEEEDAEEDSNSDNSREAPVIRRREQGGSMLGRQSQPQLPHYLKGHKPDKEFGGWERHTRGIGQKLLQKMGFKMGEGLGRAGQGITTPVEATKRKGRAGVAFHGTERTERSLIDYPVVDSDEENEKEFQEKLQQWKRQPEGKKQKPKYIYKTAQEVIESGGKRRKAKSADVPKVKVIDMTGKEQRVLSGYHAIGQHHDKPDEEEVLIEAPKQRRAFDMPELLHNLDLLVDLAEDEIVQNDRRLRHGKDSLVNMEHEKERLETICDQEEKQINRLKMVLDIVESCENRIKPDSPNPLTIDECVSVFQSLQNDFHEEYKMYDMNSLAIAIVFPLMKQFFRAWEPLQYPGHGIKSVEEWKVLLADRNLQYNCDINNMDTYQRLIWDVWLPPVRTAVLQWNVRNSQPLISLLNNWLLLLPAWILENILDQLVLPRLLQEVEDWNPLTDTIPIHAWLHPWLPLMGEKLEPLYAPIRHKLANALTSWHPSDVSAKIILEPWVGVFKPGHMDAFLMKNIVPKLMITMQEFVINPHQQILDPWRWVMAWRGIIPQHAMVTMMEKAFFPKWLQVLCGWLTNMPNYEEITKWYLGWKSQFPEEYLAHPTIKDFFNKALEIMNRAVSGHFQPGMKENMAYFTLTERRQMDAPPIPPPPPPMSHPPPPPPEPIYRGGGSNLPTTFKDLVERQAQDHDLLFMPLPGKSHEAKQVYRFGRMQIYLDKNVIFMLDNQQWIPVSLQMLTDKAK